mmetsp:Transcript_82961/g.138472  ORF Transcript_82961/g.138472 Transcript_82961/m.138472 type:complete len:516 (+) Transcript_82961:1169-2716(+)
MGSWVPPSELRNIAAQQILLVLLGMVHRKRHIWQQCGTSFKQRNYDIIHEGNLTLREITLGLAAVHERRNGKPQASFGVALVVEFCSNALGPLLVNVARSATIADICHFDGDRHCQSRFFFPPFFVFVQPTPESLVDFGVQTHVCRQNHLQHGITNVLVLLPTHARENVVSWVLHQIKYTRAMVVLQHRAVVVQRGQVRVSTDVEIVVETGMVEVVYASGQEARKHVIFSHFDGILHVALVGVHDVVGNLDDVCGVSIVVVRVLVVPAFHCLEKVHQDGVVDVEVLYQAILIQESVTHAEERGVIGCLLQCENIEIPLVDFLQDRVDLLGIGFGTFAHHDTRVTPIFLPNTCHDDFVRWHSAGPMLFALGQVQRVCSRTVRIQKVATLVLKGVAKLVHVFPDSVALLPSSSCIVLRLLCAFGQRLDLSLQGRNLLAAVCFRRFHSVAVGLDFDKFGVVTCFELMEGSCHRSEQSPVCCSEVAPLRFESQLQSCRVFSVCRNAQLDARSTGSSLDA